MNWKEKKIILYAGAGLIVVIFLLLHFVIKSRIDTYRTLSARFKEDARVVESLAEEAKKYSIDVVRENMLPPNFSLFSYVEKEAREAGLNVRAINPSGAESKGSVKEVTVVIVAKETSFTSVVKFLYSIEYASDYYLRVKKLNLERSFRNPSVVDAKIEVNAFQRER